MSAEAALAALGRELPAPFPPAGAYVSCVRTGNLLVLGGHIPHATDRVVLGRLGEELDVEAGREAAELAALSALATLRHELGTLDAVARIVSVRASINATPGFTAHTQVADAASELLVAVFGERGHHARIALGVSSLPVNLALELELLVEVTPPG